MFSSTFQFFGCDLFLLYPPFIIPIKNAILFQLNVNVCSLLCVSTNVPVEVKCCGVNNTDYLVTCRGVGYISQQAHLQLVSGKQEKCTSKRIRVTLIRGKLW